MARKDNGHGMTPQEYKMFLFGLFLFLLNWHFLVPNIKVLWLGAVLFMSLYQMALDWQWWERLLERVDYLYLTASPYLPPELKKALPIMKLAYKSYIR